jgi:hypothetical protein
VIAGVLAQSRPANPVSPRSPSTYNGSLFFFRVGDSLRAFYDDGTASHDCPSEPLIIDAPVRFRHRESRLLFGFEIPIQDGRVAEQVHIFELFEVLPVLAILKRSIWALPFQVLNITGDFDTIH